MAFLELSSVYKHFGTFTAVDDFNIDVERGEFVSFLGPSGCGKTTTLRMIAGFELPTGGAIHVNGMDVTRNRPNQRNVGMVFQSYALFPNMNVEQNIGFGLRLKKLPRQQIQQRVSELLNLIHLPGKGKSYPYQLSGGQQQRVALARALAIEPQVLLLDEPLSALDAKIRVSLRNEIRAIQRQLGITTVYVTHDQEEALSLSDRIVVMNEGRIEQIGTPFEIYNFPATSFVASFVGSLNTLSAKIIHSATGEVEVDGQPIRLAQPLAYGRSGNISLALRPEIISMANGAGAAAAGAGDAAAGDGAAASGVNYLTATVEDVTFLGSLVRVETRLPTHSLHFFQFNNPRLTVLQRGEVVKLTFPADACLVLEDDRA
jgi:putative spermidine/putrescine transport system ATP-binding protein